MIHHYRLGKNATVLTTVVFKWIIGFQNLERWWWRSSSGSQTLGEPPDILFKNACAYTYLGISKSLDVRWGPVIYIFNMHSGWLEYRWSTSVLVIWRGSLSYVWISFVVGFSWQTFEPILITALEYAVLRPL